MIASAIAAVVVALGLLLLGRRVRVRAQVKANGRDGESWRAAAGGAVGPVAFTAGLSPDGSAWSAHVLGYRLERSGRRSLATKRTSDAVRRNPSRAFGVAIDGALLATRHVRFDRVDARIHGAADDPATSARIMGLIAAGSAALFPRARVTTDVDWMADVAFVDVDCDVEASFVPLLVGWDVARLALHRRMG